MTYQIEWVPTVAIEALADSRGRPSPDESPLDYCEVEDAARYATAKTFDKALKIAETKLTADYFGQVRIEHLVKVQSRYMRDRWAADAVWHYSEGDLLHEDAPEHQPEIDLVDDEHIVADGEPTNEQA